MTKGINIAEKMYEVASVILRGVHGGQKANFTKKDTINFCEHLSKHTEKIIKLEEELSKAKTPQDATVLGFRLKKEKSNARKQVSLVAPEYIDEEFLEKLRTERDADFEEYNKYLADKKLNKSDVQQKYVELKEDHQHKTSDRTKAAEEGVEKAACLLMKFLETNLAINAIEAHLKFLGNPNEIVDLCRGAKATISADAKYLQNLKDESSDIKSCYPAGFIKRYILPIWDKQGVVAECQSNVAERVLYRKGYYTSDYKLDRHKIACMEDDEWDRLESEITAKTEKIKSDLNEGAHLHRFNPLRTSAPTHKLVDFILDKTNDAAGLIKASLFKRLAVVCALLVGYIGLKIDVKKNEEEIAHQASEVAAVEKRSEESHQIIIPEMPSVGYSTIENGSSSAGNRDQGPLRIAD